MDAQGLETYLNGMTTEQIIALVVFGGANFIAASSGAVFKPGDWYESLNFPSWRPPNWLFPIAWTALYIMIAVAGWLVWRDGGGLQGAAVPLAVYAVQLVLNGLWSGIFFGLKRLDWALYELALLWGAIVGCIILFLPISSLAAYLMVPYLAWVSFAGVLNLTMLRLNGKAPVAST